MDLCGFILGKLEVANVDDGLDDFFSALTSNFSEQLGELLLLDNNRMKAPAFTDQFSNLCEVQTCKWRNIFNWISCISLRPQDGDFFFFFFLLGGGRKKMQDY